MAATASAITATVKITETDAPTTAATTTPEATTTRAISLTMTTAALLTRLPTPTPSPSPEPSRPPDSTIIEFITAAVEPQTLGSFPSPDSQWLAEVVVYECTPVVGAEESAYEEVRIVAVGGEREEVVDTQLQFCGGLVASGFEGLLWAANSRYFYYTPAREGVPDGCGYWTQPYKRADVTTGEVVWLGGGTLSPDRTMLATWQVEGLVIWDLGEGEVGRVDTETPNDQQGPIVWTPDGRSVAYLLSTSFCPSGRSAVFRVDLADLEAQLLLESEAPGFVDLAWEKPEQLRLFTAEGQEWHYEFAMQELEVAP